ncbi:hypothetical protein [Streptomyces echinatus]|uniref:hypothetical protein n=1 Tax=Streptomyces echinatus TaxID=67293 RepID=UPI003CD0B1B3
MTREPAALALGWVDDMPGLLAACYALVDNAAGQTAVQALATGLPVVGHRPLPGHGADGVRRMAELGLSALAPDAPRAAGGTGRAPGRRPDPHGPGGPGPGAVPTRRDGVRDTLVSRRPPALRPS